jgi:hypothetical protein
MPGSPFLTFNRPRLDLDEAVPGLGQDNATVMSGHPMILASPLFATEPARHELSEARGVLCGTVLGGLVWATLLYVVQII